MLVTQDPERTFDFRALAILMRSGIGWPFGFLRWMRETKPRFASISSFFCDR